MKRLKLVLFSANIAVYLILILTSILYFSLFDNRDDKYNIYLIVYIIEGAACILISIGFLIYGIILFKNERKAREYEKESKKELAKITICTIMFSLCFTFRGVFCFLRGTRAMIDKNSREFLPLTIMLPELIPVAIQLYIIITTKTKQNEIETYRKTLYDEDDRVMTMMTKKR